MSLVATHLTRRLEEPAVVDASLRVDAGEIVALLGPSGSGKTTLLNMLALIDRPQSGTLEIAGLRPWDLGARARDEVRLSEVGLLFRELSLIRHLSVLHNVLLPAWRLGSREAEDYARDLLTQFGLHESLWRRAAGALSRADAQRVAIARALINQPAVVLADEPTGSLEGASANWVLDALESLRGRDVATLIVTHDPAVAARADRTLDLVDGMLGASR